MASTRNDLPRVQNRRNYYQGELTWKLEFCLRIKVDRTTIHWRCEILVPECQRTFAWGADVVEELWEDLIAASERKGDYFLGTIVLQKTGSNTYGFIDGQQRLTCITMIFSAIRNVYLAARDERAADIQSRFMGAKGFSRDSVVRPRLVLNRINNELFVQSIESNDFDVVEKALKAKKLPEPNKLLLQL